LFTELKGKPLITAASFYFGNIYSALGRHFMSIRILIIEDDDLILATLEEMYRNEGYEVYSTKFGDSGRKMVMKHRPDLVILDWMLPDTTGLEICKLIRSESDTPILMITGRKSVEDRVLAFDYGADDFMGKPMGI
jgi:two-component system alkaline phosphatase synthesis response regulator PhoP